MQSKTSLTIEALRKLKLATSAELADVTGIPAEQISMNLRAIIRADKYGVFRHGISRAKNNTECNVWGLDEGKYQAYMERKAHLEATKRPPSARKIFDPTKEEKVDYNRDFPRPVTQYHTCWQPSSPYYKESP